MEYDQGFTTNLPTDSELLSLQASNFAGSKKDYTYYIEVLKQLGLGTDTRIFDFGCSWGYGSYQLVRAGYDVTSFEIDRTRARFAQDNLGVECIEDMDELMTDPDHIGRYDCFFSAHVLEHVARPARVFAYARKLVRAGGLFVSFTPNGGTAFRKKEPTAWGKLWGEVHPNFIDKEFLDVAFRDAPRAIASSPVTAVKLPNDTALQILDPLERSELMFIARLTP
jgi:SAM-dependent methyltransferase